MRVHEPLAELRLLPGARVNAKLTKEGRDAIVGWLGQCIKQLEASTCGDYHCVQPRRVYILKLTK